MKAAGTIVTSLSTLRVRYAETDRMGVVYYANYFVWFEVARADLLRTLGWSYREMEETGVQLPVIEAQCDYRRPARYDDEIEVRTEGRLTSPVRLEFAYQVSVKGQSETAASGLYSSRGPGPRRAAVPAASASPRGVRVTPAFAGGRRDAPAVYSIGEVRPRGRGVAQKGLLLFACRRVLTLVTALVVLSSVAACGRHKSNLPAPGSVEEDKYLYDRGMELLAKKNWLVAREYFKRLIDTYPQSIYRNDARLGVGDSYIGENRIDSFILAVNEFKMFLQFAPLNQRADYAQYKICLAQSRQMLSPQRDQTATREALADCDGFLRNYPNSRYRTEVETIRRRARDRLSDHEFGVGLTYFRFKLWQGADSRFRGVIAEDPGYTRMDQVYYYLAETLMRGSAGQRSKEALPLYQRVVTEFPKSEFLKKSQKRIAEIENPAPIKAPAAVKR